MSSAQPLQRQSGSRLDFIGSPQQTLLGAETAEVVDSAINCVGYYSAASNTVNIVLIGRRDGTVVEDNVEYILSKNIRFLLQAINFLLVVGILLIISLKWRDLLKSIYFY